MTEWIDTHPVVDVPLAEYQRLLGYPRGHEMNGRPQELAEWALAWYAANGHPWSYAREAKPAQSSLTDGESVAIEGVVFESSGLRRHFARFAAEGAVLAAFSAGPDLEHEANRLWRDEKPDEYYFLEVLGAAVVERLAAMTGARLCAWAERNAAAVLPHYSPGYPDWDIAQQPRLLALLRGGATLPGPLEALASGALRPKKSLLAVFGLTRHADVRPLTDVLTCQSCSLASCQYRRRPATS